MFFAEAPTLTISIEAAGTMAVGIAGGLVGAVKLLVNYLREKDKLLVAEFRNNREDRRSFTDTIVRIHGEAMKAVHSVSKVLTVINTRLDIEDQDSHQGDSDLEHEESQ